MEFKDPFFKKKMLLGNADWSPVVHGRDAEHCVPLGKCKLKLHCIPAKRSQTNAKHWQDMAQQVSFFMTGRNENSPTVEGSLAGLFFCCCYFCCFVLFCFICFLFVFLRSQTWACHTTQFVSTQASLTPCL